MIFPFRKKFPVILPHREHLMSRGHVDKAVLDILYRLRKNGYDAYLVGGCVRDILLDKTPKDFDIVTDARPRQIKRLFSRCFLIGRRFRLAHVYISKDRFVEVATFRALVDREEVKEGPRFAENNVFGTIEEDAQRRDFTVNALYFNGADSSIVDYTGGLDDLKKKVLRSVGKAAARFKEDPVRIIRAARFCAQLGFTPSRRDYKAAVASAPLIKEANASRMLEELYKILRCGASAGTFMNLEKYRILCYWLPELADRKYHEKLLARLAAVDRRRARGEEIPVCVLLTALFYDICEEAAAGRKNIHEAFIAVKERYQEMAVRLRFPKAEWDRVCNTVARQDVFRRTSGGARWGRFVKNFTSNDYFPDALRFFEILSEAEGKYREELNYWKRQAPARSAQEQSQPEAPPEQAERTKKRRRRRRPRKRNGPPSQERQAT